MTPMPRLDVDEVLALLDDMAYGPYLMHPTAQLLTLDHEVLADLSDRVIDGQVDCKLDGRLATRTCTMTLADPSHEVAVDGADAGDGAFFYDKMISAGIRFKGPRIGRWVTIPLFCGPMTNGGRVGYTAQVTAQGKDRLATGMVWDPLTYPAGTGKTAVIRAGLEQTGEDPNRIILPDLPGRIPKDITLSPTDNQWASTVVPTQTSMNRQGMYDAAGDYRLRSWPEDPKFVFTDGLGGTILTDPAVTYDQYLGWNGVRVRGAVKPNGKHWEAVRWLPRNHPCSPWSRMRGGVPFRMAFLVDNPKVRTQDEADQIAERHLRRLVREVTHVTADVMPNWLLEPGDIAAFRTRSLGNIEQVMREFSLPLLPGVPMSVGATRYLTGPNRQPVKDRIKPIKTTTRRRSAA